MLLQSDLWVQAWIRRAQGGGAYPPYCAAATAARARSWSRSVDRRHGVSRLYAEAVRGDGEQVWMEPLSATDEAALDAYAERAAARDPDLWVLEVGRHQRAALPDRARGAPGRALKRPWSRSGNHDPQRR
jgi:hypothetical protein